MLGIETPSTKPPWAPCSIPHCQTKGHLHTQVRRTRVTNYALGPVPPIRRFRPETRIIPTTTHGNGGPAPQGPIANPAPSRILTKREVGAIEEGWLNQRPFFQTPIPHDGLVTPHGRTKPYYPGISEHEDRVTEIHFLAKDQCCSYHHNWRGTELPEPTHSGPPIELSTLPEELKANGFTGISLSSSLNDDETRDANVSEQRTGKVALKWDPETLAPITRRIEWERFILACSQSQRIYAKVKDDESMTLATTDKRMTREQLAAYAPTIRTLVAERSGDELTQRRIRARHYGAVVTSMMSPQDLRAWRYGDYLHFADTNTARVEWTVDYNAGREYDRCFHEQSENGCPVPGCPGEDEPRRDAKGDLITQGPAELTQHYLGMDVDDASRVHDPYEVLREGAEIPLDPRDRPELVAEVLDRLVTVLERGRESVRES